MSFLVAGAALLVLYGVCRLLNMSSTSSQPALHYRPDSELIQSILAACPIFLQTYVPPLLWGKSGHIQTIIYGKLGRVKPPFLKGKRERALMKDGATLTYDIFESIRSHPTGGDYTLLVCPGISNSSESSYICTFVDYALEHGFRVVVQNHLGAMKSVKLTAPRMNTYGCTGEFHLMTLRIKETYPRTKLIAVGFSMGANVVTKYMGEDAKHQENFLAAMSICQGYDLSRAIPFLMSWSHLRRCYFYAMTVHQHSLLRCHHDELFNEEATKRYGHLDVPQIYKTTSLVALDNLYSKKRHGFEKLKDFYTWCSSANFINNITLPMLILNSEDDPLVPPDLHDVPKSYVAEHKNALFVVTKHGGHLGFFEHGLVKPDRITWLDRAVLQFANAVVSLCDIRADQGNPQAI
ncbi:monoacylglycerol lipase ABHD2-like [Liolophura sinensis]|uniref:monoacylglycerol lipase ABHD2-like n=1 Tax=Liolophura sinensis TaxID=3198878 RepID=UPI00315958D3